MPAGECCWNGRLCRQLFVDILTPKSRKLLDWQGACIPCASARNSLGTPPANHVAPAEIRITPGSQQFAIVRSSVALRRMVDGIDVARPRATRSVPRTLPRAARSSARRREAAHVVEADPDEIDSRLSVMSPVTLHRMAEQLAHRDPACCTAPESS